jgi:hypothetical protein
MYAHAPVRKSSAECRGAERDEELVVNPILLTLTRQR